MERDPQDRTESEVEGEALQDLEPDEQQEDQVAGGGVNDPSV